MCRAKGVQISVSVYHIVSYANSNKDLKWISKDLKHFRQLSFQAIPSTSAHPIFLNFQIYVTKDYHLEIPKNMKTFHSRRSEINFEDYSTCTIAAMIFQGGNIFEHSSLPLLA